MDVDEEVMRPKLSGDFANAGILMGDSVKELMLSYNCLESKEDVETIVELSIEMILY